MAERNGWRWSTSGEAEPSMVPTMRRALCETLRGNGLGHLVDTAALMSSELLTNAVVHSYEKGARITMRVEATGATLRVSVTDQEPRFPILRRSEANAEGGYGLWIINTCATRWGCDYAAGRKSVWFELSTEVRHEAGREQPTCAVRTI